MYLLTAKTTDNYCRAAGSSFKDDVLNSLWNWIITHLKLHADKVHLLSTLTKSQSSRSVMRWLDRPAEHVPAGYTTFGGSSVETKNNQSNVCFMN